jgi:H+-transporting ATPase
MQSNSTPTDHLNHLNTTIESGSFDEKHHDQPPAKKPVEDEEEDEDMDALIDELESQDGHAEEEEGEDDQSPVTGRVIPEDQLQTDTRIGLTEAEVITRRKKWGPNQMKEEKENLILKFLGYFIGPIQFVMEVKENPLRFVLSRSILLALPHVSYCRPRSHIFWPKHTEIPPIVIHANSWW